MDRVPPRVVLAGVLAVLCGCTSAREWVHNGFKVGPNYHRPPAPVAPAWIDSNDPRVQSIPFDDSQWWNVFHDPMLDSLVHAAYEQNLPLREAGFRVLQSRARLGISIGNLFPQTQTTNGDYLRHAVSGAVANRQATPERFYSQWDYGFNLSWELDVWGRLRRLVESSNATYDATIEDYDAVLVTLVGDVAQAYAQYRTLQARIYYARTNAELQRKTLALVTDRFKGGAVSELDVTQAAANLAQTEGTIPPLEASLRQTANQLCILLGIPPEDLTKHLGAGPIPSASASVALGIPADLLRRRPDVRSAERRAAAQSAQIGVAEAELYPQFSLTGTLGWSAEEIKEMFKPVSFRGLVGPTFTWNILNYGRLVNGIRVQDARFQELALAYQNTVLTANQEVENGLVAFLQAQEQVKAEERAVKASARSVELVEIQYREGKVDYNRVFVLQRDLTERQNNLAVAQGQVAFGLIQTYRALGGGWQIRCPTDGDGHSPAADCPPADAAEPLPAPKPLPEPEKDQKADAPQEKPQ